LRSVAGDLLDIDTWKGAWFIANQTVQYQANTVQRRLHGEYETDEWGMDLEVLEAVTPFFEFLYRKYWRVTLTGLEYVPKAGRALLVVNHSGQLPFDGAMLASGISFEHPRNRLVRTMFACGSHAAFEPRPLLRQMRASAGDRRERRALLESEELFPSSLGYKGVGKLYKERYQLARFGRGGFIRMALKTRSPILPVAVVGAEETYMSIAKSDVMAKLIGFPYFPITPTFPLLGPLGVIPMPTKWYIDIGEPIPMDGHSPKAEFRTHARFCNSPIGVRGVVQKMINERLAQRKSVFRG
jgi:1-acyl-sn-glycerol-3-phosphate acyltransferase